MRLSRNVTSSVQVFPKQTADVPLLSRAFSLLMLAMMFSFSGTVSAQSLIIKTNACTGFDAQRQGFLIEGRSVLLKTNSGKEVYQCTGQLPENAVLPEKTIHYDFDNTNGTPCELHLFDERFGTTENWQMTVTPSGHVTLICMPDNQ